MSPHIEILRRESLISVLSTPKSNDERFAEKIRNAPKDAFLICFIFFFFMGFMTLMPMIFIGTAINYWMFKFRNASAPADDGNRTSLQSLYQSALSVAISVPTVLFTLLGTIHGRKFDARKLILFALVVIFFIFLTFSSFTRVNTDSWQSGFFIMSMMLLAVNSSAVAVYQLSSMVLVAKFPSNFMKWFLLGQSGGILTDLLQIICISVTDSAVDGALIYFLTGTVLVTANFCISFGIKYSKLYAYYTKDSTGDQETKKNTLSWSEMKNVIKLIWPGVTIVGTVIFTTNYIDPSVTSLVESQNYGDGSAWANKYFTPVIVFLLSDVSSLVGQIISLGRVTRSNFTFWMGGTVMRTVLSVGIIIFCNAKPRSHLSVVFDKDWQFILFIVLYNISGGLLINVGCLSVPGLSEGQPEIALKLLSVFISVTAAAFSANGVLIVKLL
ncbi:equilibrative nucleoside transporter 3-like isoform X1 [Leptinotarsa decemlineata]|uniref:equilibrative nucleoside transporter 3-like isoform X1 n=2 Tax=Leptinotarsa decemlineata TaxID=7539 RepID=UPI003D308CE6